MFDFPPPASPVRASSAYLVRRHITMTASPLSSSSRFLWSVFAHVALPACLPSSLFVPSLPPFSHSPHSSVSVSTFLLSMSISPLTTVALSCLTSPCALPCVNLAAQLGTFFLLNLVLATVYGSYQKVQFVLLLRPS